MDTTSVEKFYQQITADDAVDIRDFLPPGIHTEIGHFNVFSIDELHRQLRQKPVMPYNRRAYYKISLICGRNRAEYADKVIDIDRNALLFATPKVPYHYVPQDTNQSGYFCIFTDAFLSHIQSGIVLDELPIFRPGGYPVFSVTDDDFAEISLIFRKMQREITSDYVYKYDLLRAYLLELIHYGQKLQPATSLYPSHTASARVSSLFIELLERQFPIESPRQRLTLRSAKEYADHLAIHVNHLNKVLKESTGRTTTDLISSRMVQEAKILLKQTDWQIAEIAYCLGFAEASHFSNFFKKHAAVSPIACRA